MTDVDSPMEDGPGSTAQTSIVYSTSTNHTESRLEAREINKFLLAKSFFDCREFDRCAAVFVPSDIARLPRDPGSPNVEGRPSDTQARRLSKGKGHNRRSSSQHVIKDITLPKTSQKALFLGLYARYISGEKRKDEDAEMVLGPADKGATQNKQLLEITQILEAYFRSRTEKHTSDGWLEYLYGIVLSRQKIEDEAKKWIIRSIQLFPYHWGAWLELNDLLKSKEDLQQVLGEIPQNVMAIIFHIFASQELYQSTDQVHQELTQLDSVFPDNPFLKTQRALLFYHTKEFDEAENVFSSILHKDPHRIDSLDHYSNILYVMSNRPKLAFVAQLATATDKFRPETCCVVGNYYSLKSEHEKAVQYFRRALTLDRRFLSAWTLMGHEYVEMKNTHAAIESYRRAVDVNRKDYRAWYGLGQTYEILEMHLYALFYYQRAASLRPYDPKMWQAVAACYDKLEKPMQSIRAYKRALVANTFYETSSSFSSAVNEPSSQVMDPEILHAVAVIYDRIGNLEEAASYMEMTLAQEEGPDPDDDDETKTAGTGVTNTTSKARMWLAKHEASHGGLRRAMELANELCQDGVEVEEAKALIRDLRARMEDDTR